jgi:DNA-binding NarL/FixJ family response regulator
MPRLGGLEATRRIRSRGVKTEVLVLTMHDSEQVVREVLDAGARGYLLKSDAGRELIAAVEAVADHRPYFTSRVASMVLDGYLRKGASESVGTAVGRLSGREQEILQLLAEGRSNKEVASALAISVKTVETHRTNIMRKLDLHSLSDLVRYAVRNKIVEA